MKSIVLENKKFALTIGEDAIAKSLIYKATGEEMLETEEQAKSLLEVGCEFLQGFYFSQPVPPDEYLNFLANSKELLDKKMAFVKQNKAKVVLPKNAEN